MSKEAYYLLNHNLATYKELGESVSLEDAFNLMEFHRVSQHNKSLLDELKRELNKN